jgi:hypothetical protein
MSDLSDLSDLSDRFQPSTFNSSASLALWRLLRICTLILVFAAMALAENGARYLVITHDNFYGAVQPLAQWKTQKGMSAKVVKTSEIGSNPSNIQNYIRNAYNNWPIRPEYVLIVGAPSYVAASRSGTDDGYGDMSGNLEVELPVGRFFCTAPAECSTMVTKSLAYEKTPFAGGDSTWMLRGTTIVREDNPPDQYYQTDSRYIRGLWSAAGFLQTESLISTAGHNSTNVRNAINAGRGFVTHRGQCVANWWSPFDQVQPSTLSNGAKLPIVVSGSCQTLTLDPGQSMLADQFVRAGTPQSLRGAVAYFGTTAVGSHISQQRGIITRGFFAALFEDFSAQKIGDACKRGKFYLDSLLPGNQTYYEEWNLLGDPELPVWTDKPMRLVVSHDSLVPLGPCDLAVNVTRGGSPLPGALVCARMDSTTYAWGLADPGGNVTLRCTTYHVGSMQLTVTGRNALPYEGTVAVTAGNAPYLVYRHSLIDDTQGGNGDGRVNPGETIRLPVMLANAGDSVALGVQAGLAASDTFARIQDSLQNYGDIPARDSALSAGPYVFSVAPSCTCGQSLDLQLHIRDNPGHTWNPTFGLPVYAARIAFEASLVNDAPPGGNGNGRLDPRESARLIVNLRNLGTDPLHDVAAVLRLSSPHVSLTDSTGYFGDIPVGLSASNSNDPFAMITSPNLPSPPLTFTLLIRGQGSTYQYEHTTQFQLTPSGNSGPIGPDAYGYYCYDDTDTLSGRAPVFSWLELAPPGPGQLVPGVTNSDAGLDTLPLPFRFKYYGSNYDTVTIASNGFLAFGRTGNRGGENSHIPNPDSARYRNLLPMWDDMNPDQNSNGHGDIYQYYDAPNHRWIIEYYQVSHYWSQSTQETFQMMLLDPAYYPSYRSYPSYPFLAASSHADPTDGEILFLYSTVADPNYATVGIQDNAWTRGIQYQCNGAYDPNAALITDRRAQRYTTLAPLPSPREWLTLSGTTIDDSAGGNNNHIAEPGETVHLILTLLNQGEAPALTTQGTLRASDNNTTVLDSLAEFGDIPAHNQGDNAADPLVFQTAGLPSDSLARFDLVARSQNATSILYFTIPLGNVSGLAENGIGTIRRYALATWPNPARGPIAIRLALPESGPLSLSIYDATGRLVQKLAGGEFTRGIHEVRWDGREIASGIYFCRLNVGERQLVRKLEIVH